MRQNDFSKSSPIRQSHFVKQATTEIEHVAVFPSINSSSYKLFFPQKFAGFLS